MTITVFIRYQIDPFKRGMFEQYAKRWSLRPWVPAFAGTSGDEEQSVSSEHALARTGDMQ